MSEPQGNPSSIFYDDDLIVPPVIDISFDLNSIERGTRLDLEFAVTIRILSDILQTYLLRIWAVTRVWRGELKVEIISRRPCSIGSFNSSGIMLYIRLASTKTTGHLALIRKCSTSRSNLLLKPLITHSPSSCFPDAQS